eukprot:TRINITY_DN23474_c0_g1_i1.p1 TRINITY_DN23474_c0_g1~~TRINITY_DN23474_c0_g1_i1.p1  ORF type:complete len:148 (+),score=39.66 TRINITY_DN23474_c0_g1_i1:115-558(+)
MLKTIFGRGRQSLIFKSTKGFSINGYFYPYEKQTQYKDTMPKWQFDPDQFEEVRRRLLVERMMEFKKKLRQKAQETLGVEIKKKVRVEEDILFDGRPNPDRLIDKIYMKELYWTPRRENFIDTATRKIEYLTAVSYTHLTLPTIYSV